MRNHYTTRENTEAGNGYTRGSWLLLVNGWLPVASYCFRERAEAEADQLNHDEAIAAAL